MRIVTRETALPPTSTTPGKAVLKMALRWTSSTKQSRKAQTVEVGKPSAALPEVRDDHASPAAGAVFVTRALARLNPAHQEILRAVYFADRTAVQAAEVLDLPVGTVKSGTYHALRRLKVYLEEEMSCSSAA